MKHYLFTALLAILLLGGCQAEPPYEFAGIELADQQTVPSVVLQGADGPVALDQFKGKYLFLYFGYTYCPDVCPLTLTQLARVRRELGTDGSQIQVVMVSVDPERDTPDRLAEFVGYFDDSFVGVTGEPAAIDAAGQPFGLYYAKQEGASSSAYLVDHTSRFFLADPNGTILVAYPHDVKTADLIADMQHLLNQDT